MPARIQPLAITTGEPAGIGPEISLAMAVAGTAAGGARTILLGDRGLLEACARRMEGNVTSRLCDYRAGIPATADAIEVLHVPLGVAVSTGRVDTANARYVLGLLDRACDGCLRGEFSAMVTAPVHKAVINDAGIAFSGHTEYLAERTHTNRVVMMLVGGGLRVALATTHLPLRAVPDALTAPWLEQGLRIVLADLTQKFGIARPRVLVAGLNPHAGEGGHLGCEDEKVIAPVAQALRSEGFDVQGPLPADTLFVPSRIAQADCVLAMYHDQGLPVLKYASFGGGVNVTLGLPIVRTSVDHGTALDIAGTGRADAGSMVAAVKLAVELATTNCRA